MKQQVAVRISIPNSCGQPWREMRPTAGGRHCGHCQKAVMDFTKMTDAQIIAFLQKEPFGCGRFRDDQLNRSLIATTGKSSFMTKWYISLLLLLGLDRQGYAQHRTPPKHKTHQMQACQNVVKGKPMPEAQVKHHTDSLATKTADQIEKMGMRNIADIASLSTGVYQGGSGGALTIGARSTPTVYIIDGIQYTSKEASRRRSFWRRMQFWRK